MQLEGKTGFTIRLRTVFSAIVVATLLLPLSGAYFFRIYENELIRQTESELIDQAVFISALYREKLSSLPVGYGLPVRERQIFPDEKYHVYPAALDLRAAAILPRRPPAQSTPLRAHPAALRAGRALLPLLEEVKNSTLASMGVLDPQGIVVAGQEETGLSLAGMEEVQRALMGVYASVIRQRISDQPAPALNALARGSDIRIFVAMPVIRDDRVMGVAYLSRSPRNVLNALYDERESALRAAIFILCMAAGIAGLLSYAIGQPVGALTGRVRQLTQGGKPALPPKPPFIRELAVLAQSFERMSETVTARSDYIRSFAMNLAHEFKTPLTAIKGAIELLHDHPEDMMPEQRARFMANISQDAERLRHLVNRLLELARADVTVPTGEKADLSAVLAALRKRYAGALSVKCPDEALFLGVGGDILETIFVNLFENSVQHGARSVTVSCDRTLSGSVIIDVADDGKGISGGNAERLFTPFFTTRREGGGTGLGLAIIRSLLHTHAADICFVPGAGGAHFRLTFQAI